MRRRLVAFVGGLTALLVLGARGQNDPPELGTPQVFSDLNRYKACDARRNERNFLGSLDYTGCDMIIESALAQVAMLKLAQPNAELESLKERIDELVFNGGTARVRYKAYLTSLVFAHPEIFVAEKYNTYTDGEEFFAALSERLRRELLAGE